MRFEDDWATGLILRQYINGKQKYENAKASGKATVRGNLKRKRGLTPLSSNKRSKRLPPADNEMEEMGSDNGGTDREVEEADEVIDNHGDHPRYKYGDEVFGGGSDYEMGTDLGEEGSEDYWA